MKVINQSASATRYEAELTRLGFARMQSIDPIQQAEAIAKHYASHALAAMEILRIIQARGRTPSEICDEAIDYLIEGIKRDHRTTFGIELKWETYK